jgi:hypothetical protein
LSQVLIQQLVQLLILQPHFLLQLAHFLLG